MPCGNEDLTLHELGVKLLRLCTNCNSSGLCAHEVIRLKILSATCARELKEGQDAGMLEKLLGPTYLLYILGLPENRILLETESILQLP